MATTTMRLHRVLELTPDIGLKDYPIWDENYRESLNKKIIENYMNQEIGLETISMFTFAVRRKMNQIMPYYNQLYKSAQLEFDPLATVDIRNFSVNSGNATSEEDSTSNSTSDSQSRAIASNFPQVRLAGNKDYASTGQDNVSQSVADSLAKGKSSTKQDGTTDTRTTGFQGNRSALLMEYRQTFLNVDMLVIGELDDCFMQVWSNGDSYVNEGFYF